MKMIFEFDNEYSRKTKKGNGSYTYNTLEFF